MTSLGPVPMPVVIVVLALLLASAMAHLWAQRRRSGAPMPSAAGLLLDMLLLGLLAGRLTFAVAHLDAYLAAPWSLLQIADGGYHWPVVVLVAAAWAVWRLRGHPALRVLVLASALVGVLAWAGGSALLSAWQAERLPVPSVAVVDLHGAPVDLRQYAGKPLVLNLWASWCGPCRREMPVLMAAQRANTDVQFVFVNQGEDLQQVQAFLDADGLELGNVLLDADAATSSALGVRAYPSTLFFGADGRLRELHLGELTAPALDHKLRQLR
ncbi:MAG: Thiol-disulfide oxidoreductase ResA [Stenotrophomonas maltophilia]|uniref:Thiol-disulfide oxidoreductase ResA n=1 Tax=Stenotrophomonas maltophilia TaxID=40324 RepID=A0A7V8FD47_STEMA|nr:MAG: Thiol-disulfide oxidoreductase ResA [Stenotrophomonas maltophilia]